MGVQPQFEHPSASHNGTPYHTCRHHIQLTSHLLRCMLTCLLGCSRQLFTYCIRYNYVPRDLSLKYFTMFRRYLWLIALLFYTSTCLEVAPDSPCAKKCIDDPKNGNPSWSNASMTFGPNLPCLDSDYVGRNATKTGKKLADCQSCMQSSGWEDSGTGERDTTWYMCTCAPNYTPQRHKYGHH